MKIMMGRMSPGGTRPLVGRSLSTMAEKDKPRTVVVSLLYPEHFSPTLHNNLLRTPNFSSPLRFLSYADRFFFYTAHFSLLADLSPTLTICLFYAGGFFTTLHISPRISLKIPSTEIAQNRNMTMLNGNPPA